MSRKHDTYAPLAWSRAPLGETASILRPILKAFLGGRKWEGPLITVSTHRNKSFVVSSASPGTVDRLKPLAPVNRLPPLPP